MALSTRHVPNLARFCFGIIVIFGSRSGLAKNLHSSHPACDFFILIDLQYSHYWLVSLRGRVSIKYPIQSNVLSIAYDILSGRLKYSDGHKTVHDMELRTSNLYFGMQLALVFSTPIAPTNTPTEGP